MIKFKETLKYLRNDRGFSQKKLAQMLHVDQTTISTWESGVREPDYATLEKLTKIFDVSAGYLLGLEDE